jgi:ADP-heptose:LPS heptosyltransferase
MTTLGLGRVTVQAVSEYLNLYKGILILCWLPVRNVWRNLFKARVAPGAAGKVLIIHTCLIGEFAASLPAITAFVGRNPGLTVDIMVAAPLKSLAEKVRGIRRVYVASSTFGRENERGQSAPEEFDSYEKIEILLIGPEAYRLLPKIKAGRIELRFSVLFAYGLNIGAGLLSRRRPRRWAETSFLLLGLPVPANLQLDFDRTFRFTKDDEAAVGYLLPKTPGKTKVVIHTGASWVSKKWSSDKWARTLSILNSQGNMAFVFVGAGGKEQADYEYIFQRLPFPVYSIIGRTSVDQLLLLMRLADRFLGVDSGPRNLAHAADLPSVTLLGPGPHLYTPPNSRDIVIDRSGNRGLYQTFFRSRRPFIEKITPKDVVKAFNVLGAPFSTERYFASPVSRLKKST